MAYVTLDGNYNITGIYSSPQPQLSGYTIISNSDSRIAKFNNPPTAQAATAISEGLAFTSSGTPSLNGTYAVDQQSRDNISAISTYILLNSAFPTGSTLTWVDTGGGLHTFSSTTTFQQFATAVNQYVIPTIVYENTNGVIGSIPSNQVASA